MTDVEEMSVRFSNGGGYIIVEWTNAAGEKHMGREALMQFEK